jgi:hypothetical protein
MAMTDYYIVLYRTKNGAPLDPPFGFGCNADGGDHAEDQCLDVFPDADVVWVVKTTSYQAALDSYYTEGLTDENQT